MHRGLLQHPAVAAAAALPALVAGLLAGSGPGQWLGARSDTVRTVLVERPPSEVAEPELGGAHPATDPAPDALLLRDGGDRDNRARGIPVRVTGGTLPARVMLAYRRAAEQQRAADPRCHLTWPLLAGVGMVESGHAYDGAVDRQGRTLSPILGPVLDGAGPVAAIRDTDGGRYDGDTTWDRAVGPMQFIPSSWAGWGRDGDGDGEADPSDVDDAALAAAAYLCAGDRDLRRERAVRAAVYSYNHSWPYVDLVLAWAEFYATGRPVVTAGSGAARERDRDGGDVRAAGSAGPVAQPAANGPEPTTTTTTGPAPVPASAAPTVEPAPSDPAPSPSPVPSTAEPAPTGTPTSTPVPTTSPTAGPTACPTPSPSPSGTATPTGSPSPTPTPTVTETPTPTASPTGSPTGTATPTPTPTGCPT